METIEKLMEKYYNGQTSLEEEKLIRDYLSGDNYPKDLTDEKLIFNYYQSEKSNEDLSDDFDSQILGKISSERILKVNFRKRMQRFINIAAILAIAIGFYWFFSTNESDNATISQSDSEGFELTYNALAKAAVYINKVNEDLSKLEIINESLSHLDKVSYIEHYNNYIYEFLGD